MSQQEAMAANGAPVWRRMRPDDHRTRRSDDGWSSRASARWRAAGVYGAALAATFGAPALSRRFTRWVGPSAADTVTLGALVGGGWVTLGVLERLFPFRADWNVARGDVATDTGDLLLAGPLAQVIAGLMTAPVRSLARSDARAGGVLRRLPLPARVAVLVLGFDLVHSPLHRLLHERPRLWRVHAVHHSPERLYRGNAPRFHPVESVMDLSHEMVMLALLAPDRETLLAYRVARGLAGQITHCNIDIDSGALNAVLSTPERHRWHHSTDLVEGNTNYGAIVSVWDRAMGTALLPDRAFDAEIGNGDPDYPAGWVGQLVAPFR